MKIKAGHRLIPAVAMLIVAAIALTSASYAWFTMSRTVQATGMKLTAIAPTNLLISNAASGTYAETTAVTEDFGTSKLMPASSMDGATQFWATNQIKSSNAGAPDANTTWTDVKTSAISATADGYYADFKLWLKTTGEDDVPVTLSSVLSTITNKTTPGTADITGAVRFAILTGGTTPALFTGAGTGSKNVYAFDKDYFANITGPIKSTTDPKATTDAWKGVADENLTDGTVIFTVPGGTNGTSNTPIAITVRVWIEGQDADCTSDNADASLEMSVGFKDVNYSES